MDAVNLEGLSPVVDLAEVDRERRVDTWMGAATTIFPGLALKGLAPNPAVGSIQHSRMGPGALFAIASAPIEVSYIPRAAAESSQFLTMMLQAEGTTLVHQLLRQCER